MKRTATAMMLSALLLLVGCASTDGHEQWLAMEQARQARMDTLAAQCETDLCLYVVAREANQVSRLPAKSYHPIWQLAGQAMTVALPAWAAVAQTNAWGDIVQGVSGTIAQMDRADNSITVGGNFGDTDNSVNVGGNLGDTDNSTAVAGNFGDTDNSTSVGGNLGDTRRDTAGRDLAGRDTRTGDDRIGDNVGGDQFGGDYRQGDDVSDGCIGEGCRNSSDGPIDNSDPGDDGNDNSTGGEGG